MLVNINLKKGEKMGRGRGNCVPRMPVWLIRYGCQQVFLTEEISQFIPMKTS